MKHQSSFISGFLPVLLLSALILSFTACKKTPLGDTSLPELYSVTDLNNRTVELTSVKYGDWIIIKGKHLATTYKVEFNTVLAADSLIYADDSTVTVKIPPVLPDPENNPITVTTKYGVATLNFRILQPPPTITSFDPMAGPDGQVVTISGYNFGGVNSVKFGTVEATIISSTREEVKVNVPAGTTSAYIFLSTPSGTVRTDLMYGFRYLIYDEALTATWSNTSFSATAVLNNATPVRRGALSAKMTCTATFGAFRLTKTAPAVSIAGFTGVRFSVYTPTASVGKKVRVYLNGVSASGVTLTMTKEGWNDFQIPLTSLGNPTTLTTFTMQEFSGQLQVLYIDDIGMI